MALALGAAPSEYEQSHGQEKHLSDWKDLPPPPTSSFFPMK